MYCRVGVLCFRVPLCRTEWEDMSAKCPQSFKLEDVMARRDPDILERAKTEFDCLFKVPLLFSSARLRTIAVCCFAPRINLMWPSDPRATGHTGTRTASAD